MMRYTVIHLNPTYKKTYNHINEKGSIDLVEFSGYKTSSNKTSRYNVNIIHNFSN